MRDDMDRPYVTRKQAVTGFDFTEDSLDAFIEGTREIYKQKQSTIDYNSN